MASQRSGRQAHRTFFCGDPSFPQVEISDMGILERVRALEITTLPLCAHWEWEGLLQSSLHPHLAPGQEAPPSEPSLFILWRCSYTAKSFSQFTRSRVERQYGKKWMFSVRGSHAGVPRCPSPEAGSIFHKAQGTCAICPVLTRANKSLFCSSGLGWQHPGSGGQSVTGWQMP